MVKVETELRLGRRERPETWSSVTHSLGESLEADLLSVLVEKELGITGYELILRQGRLWQGDGRLFVEVVMERTLAEFSDPRFQAERQGWLALEAMMKGLGEAGREGWLVIASPPGETYRFEGVRPMSATFLFRLERDGRVRVFSVYEPEIGVEEHWRRVTVTVPEESWFRLETAEEVVATPVYVGGDEEMERVLAEFGIEGIRELEDRVAVLEEEVLDEGVRTRVVVELAQRMRELVPAGYGEVMDRVVVWVAAAWVRGEVMRWLARGGRLEAWIDAVIYGELERLGYLSQARRWAEGQGLSSDDWEEWQARWEELKNDPYFIEVFMRGGHGGGRWEWLGGEGGVVVGMGLDPLERRLKKERQVECHQCHHQFVVDGSGEARCPHCGARIKLGD